MKQARIFHFAFSPEREDPAENNRKLKVVPKVVGGYTPVSFERVIAGRKMRYK